MSKQDQATRIAGKAKMLFCGSLGDTATYEAEQIEKDIRRAITAAVRKERERCVACVDDCKMVGSYAMISIIKAITGNKRKGKR